MIDLNKYTLSEDGTAREALQLLNEIAISNTALFVVNKNMQLIGSLTDGDIRRGLLNGLTIDTLANSFMNTNSTYFIDGENNFEKVAKCREANIRFIPIVDVHLRIVRIVDLDTVRSMIPVDVVLMAGGKGERLKPLTNHIPKPMLKIGGIPIIVRNIERLTNYGVSNFYVSVKHMAEQIEDGIKEYTIANASISFIKETTPLGTIGSVKLISHFINDAVLVMNSDLLTNIDFGDFYAKFIDSKADMLVATIPYTVDVPYAIMDINEQEEVLSFSEKPRFTYYSNAGIYIFKKELIDLIPNKDAFDATHFMEKVIASKKRLLSYPILGYWLDIGRIEDFNKAQETVKHINF